jgi:hypothetical protein
MIYHCFPYYQQFGKLIIIKGHIEFIFQESINQICQDHIPHTQQDGSNQQSNMWNNNLFNDQKSNISQKFVPSSIADLYSSKSLSNSLSI